MEGGVPGDSELGIFRLEWVLLYKDECLPSQNVQIHGLAAKHIPSTMVMTGGALVFLRPRTLLPPTFPSSGETSTHCNVGAWI